MGNLHDHPVFTTSFLSLITNTKWFTEFSHEMLNQVPWEHPFSKKNLILPVSMWRIYLLPVVTKGGPQKLLNWSFRGTKGFELSLALQPPLCSLVAHQVESALLPLCSMYLDYSIRKQETFLQRLYKRNFRVRVRKEGSSSHERRASKSSRKLLLLLMTYYPFKQKEVES